MANINFKNPTQGALYCFDRGLKVFPVIPLKLGDDKAPAIKGWQEWAAAANYKKVEQYGVANSFTNWGIFTTGLIAIDLDNKKGRTGSKNFKALIPDGAKIPVTFMVRTPTGGFHLYFKGSCRNSVGKICADVDIRSTGGFTVAPGSRVDELAYEVVNDAEIAECPKWLLEIIEASSKKEVLVLDDNAGIPDGTRDDTMTKLAGAMRRHGMSYEAMLMALEVENERLCTPPLPQESIERIASSVAKYAPETANAVTDFSAVEDIESKAKQRKDFKGPAPKREWIIKNWLPAGEISSLYGSGGTGKSLLSLQLGLSVSANKSFLGLTVENPMPTLIVFCEDDDGEIHRRIEAVEAAPEFEFLKDTDIPLYLWPRVGMTNDLARISKEGNDVVEGPFRQVLEAQLSSMSRGPKLLILDTLSDVYLGDENVREKVNKFIKSHIGSLVKKFELTVLLLAHPSRTGKNTGDMLSGSTAWENSVRNRLAMIPHKDFEEVTVLKRMKANYAKSGEEIYIQWDQGRFRISDITIIAENAMTVEQKDVLIGIDRAMTNVMQRAIHPVAVDLLADSTLSHLFAGRSASTIERQIQKTLQYPRSKNGYTYWYEEREDQKPKGSRWICKKVDVNYNADPEIKDEDLDIFN